MPHLWHRWINIDKTNITAGWRKRSMYLWLLSLFLGFDSQKPRLVLKLCVIQHVCGNTPVVISNWLLLILKHLKCWLFQIKTSSCFQQGKLKFHCVGTGTYCYSLCSRVKNHIKTGFVYDNDFSCKV